MRIAKLLTGLLVLCSPLGARENPYNTNVETTNDFIAQLRRMEKVEAVCKKYEWDLKRVQDYRDVWCYLTWAQEYDALAEEAEEISNYSIRREVIAFVTSVFIDPSRCLRVGKGAILTFLASKGYDTLVSLKNIYYLARNCDWAMSEWEIADEACWLIEDLCGARSAKDARQAAYTSIAK